MKMIELANGMTIPAHTVKAVSLNPTNAILTWRVAVHLADDPDARGWTVWTGLLDLLWGRLSPRRTGLMGAELHSTPRLSGIPHQGSLFPEDQKDRRLALALAGIRRSGAGGVAVAGEELLVSWGARWYGPGEDISRKGRGLVDGRGP